MKTKLLTLVTLAFIGLSTANAQVGIGTEEPDASAILDLNSTTQGLLPPRMTDDDRNNISTPPAGLTVWCTNCGTNGEMQVYNGDAWVNLMGGGAAPPSVTSETGKVWMDRNLGANQVATSSTDAASYGDLYQWGRAADGHESRLLDCANGDCFDAGEVNTSLPSTAADVTDPTWAGKFIYNMVSPYNWHDDHPDNTLWTSTGGTNNPCPAGYRVPTEAEWQAEFDNGSNASWSNATDAYNSVLALPVAGSRSLTTGGLSNVGSSGVYWSSTVTGIGAQRLYFGFSDAYMNSLLRAFGLSVRCLKD